MKYLTSAQVRQGFLDYFASKGHKIIPSSSLVPANDPTLLFTNAGMVQFKNVFLGSDRRDYARATTSQKCMRISGKHNDLENVGPSPRHHTFFEMLGNFSFGDYFKRDAIRFAWELLTEVYGLPADRLAFTVYQNDDEAYDIWVNDIGVSPLRVARMGPKTNFWQMADTGPCGPTSEIHWDKTPGQGEAGIVSELIAESDRFLEIWNLVFMQYNRTEPDPTHTGQFDEPLPAPGVDTGMGLERIVAVVQGQEANYGTDLFTDIMDATQQILGHTADHREANYVAYRVIADHSRAAVFLIADRVNPGNTGREYITRMLIRRALRFAQRMDVREPFLYKVAEAVITKMGPVYAELLAAREVIIEQIKLEEEQFLRTLDAALGMLEETIGAMRAEGRPVMSGQEAFFLFASHGLPVELIRDALNDEGFTLDEAGFTAAREQHALDSGAEGFTKIDEKRIKRYRSLLEGLTAQGVLVEGGVIYNPYNYAELEQSVQVVAILKDGETVEEAHEGDEVELVLDRTPFYVESGGQVSDTGIIAADAWEVEVTGMHRPVGGLIVHQGRVTYGDTLRQGDRARAVVNPTRRWDIMRNHTATHLLHAALHSVLGKGATQKGSLVAPDRLRFDFNHSRPVSREELSRISTEVNELILANAKVEIAEKPREQAVSEGAMALFGEKYGDVVRTVVIGRPGTGDPGYSYELCGGTHVRSTAEIGPFVLLSEKGTAQGVRRIEAITGHAAQAYIDEGLKNLQAAAVLLNAAPEKLAERVQQVSEAYDAAQREIRQLRRSGGLNLADDLVGKAERVDGITYIAQQVEADSPDALADLADALRQKLGSGVVVLGSAVGEGAALVIGLTPDLVDQGLDANMLMRAAAKPIKGGGSGSPAFVKGGGKQPDNLPQAMALVPELLKEALAKRG